MWREWVSQSERQWNKFFNDVMGTDQYTQAMSRFTEAYVAGQKSFGEAAGRYLAAMNVATRTDVLALGDRLVAIEERLAAIEASLRATGSRDERRAAPTAAPVGPPRTKKPPAAAVKG